MRFEKLSSQGGSAKNAGLPAYLNLFHVPVSIANPWQGIQIDDAIRPAVEKLGPSFAIAVGPGARRC